MLDIILDAKKLKDALNVASLAISSLENSLESHCLFELKNKKLKIISTDKDKKIALAILDASSEEEGLFTADSKKILNLLKTSSQDSIRFSYFPETTTLEIYASEDKESFIALPSFDPTAFPAVEEIFDKSFEVKVLNAGVLLAGIRFIQEFLTKTNKSNNKFSNAFISNGIIYGTNGNNKIGAFTSPDLEGLNELVIPEIMLSPIASLIDKPDTLSIRTTSTHVLIADSDLTTVFGFTKPQVKIPRIPIDIKEPQDSTGAEINVNLLLKKIERLKITGDADLGLTLSLVSDKIILSTLQDRSSKDSMICKKIGTEDKDTIIKCRVLEDILNAFSSVHKGTYEIKMFLDKNLKFFWSGKLEIMDKKPQIKELTFAAIMTPAATVDAGASK